MAEEGYDMTGYVFAEEEPAVEEDERPFYCDFLAKEGYSQAEIVIIMESEGYDMSDYVFPTTY